MTKQEFLAQMAKVAENAEAKKAMEEAATPQDVIKAAALAGVTLSEQDLQEAASWQGETALRDDELDAVAAAGNSKGVYIEGPIIRPRPIIRPIPINIEIELIKKALEGAQVKKALEGDQGKQTMNEIF